MLELLCMYLLNVHIYITWCVIRAPPFLSNVQYHVGKVGPGVCLIGLQEFVVQGRVRVPGIAYFIVICRNYPIKIKVGLAAIQFKISVN